MQCIYIYVMDCPPILFYFILENLRGGLCGSFWRWNLGTYSFFWPGLFRAECEWRRGSNGFVSDDKRFNFVVFLSIIAAKPRDEQIISDMHRAQPWNERGFTTDGVFNNRVAGMGTSDWCRDPTLPLADVQRSQGSQEAVLRYSHSSSAFACFFSCSLPWQSLRLLAWFHSPRSWWSYGADNCFFFFLPSAQPLVLAIGMYILFIYFIQLLLVVAYVFWLPKDVTIYVPHL